ncbi:RNA polymerase II holoenzyme cyclin-like subunit [Xanthoria calcicola]
MAANYWASTQRLHWQFSRTELQDILQHLENEDPALTQQYPLLDRRLLSIFYNQQLVKLAKRMSIRQQALGTAQVYIRRFYTKVDVRNTNPYLILTTALYLACKMEESPQHIRVVVEHARSLWPDFIPSDVSRLGECEFYLISEMNSQLIIHHPYRTLQELQGRLDLVQDDVLVAWSIINDHYLTDLPLLFAPHVIAIAAIFLALTLKQSSGGQQAAVNAAAYLTDSRQAIREGSSTAASNDNVSEKRIGSFVKWLAEGEVDLQAVADSMQEIISLYDVWDRYGEKTCKDQISHVVKARGLDK